MENDVSTDGKQVPFTAKQPAEMLKPTLDVDVAEPDTFKPDSVVVPKPVAETERNDDCVLPFDAVEDETVKTFVVVAP